MDLIDCCADCREVRLAHYDQFVLKLVMVARNSQPYVGRKVSAPVLAEELKAILKHFEGIEGK